MQLEKGGEEERSLLSLLLLLQFEIYGDKHVPSEVEVPSEVLVLPTGAEPSEVMATSAQFQYSSG